ncbi:MAG TPA: hypothetical protein VF796_01565 [Humisphaera sp.]
MQQILKITAAVAVAAAGLAVLPGCQNARRADNTDRAVRASAATFDRSYVATRDTEWISNPNVTTPERGTIRSGARVYFGADTTAGGEFRQARLAEGNQIVYVRASDFSPSR